MEFRIADTFTESLARLSNDEQKAVKTTAFDLQLNTAGMGMSFHKLDRAKDKNFWSARVSSDIRIIVHRTESSLLLCYVDHHDKAYAWAERRKLEIHPKTGAAQLVEVRETVKEVIVPVYVQSEVVKDPKPKLFLTQSDDQLLGYGVPAEWLQDVRTADEDALLKLVNHLPAEASEALLELAIGGTPRTHQPIGSAINPFEHPDAQRRFRVVTDVEELRAALDSPWEKWTIFLHPDQRQFVEREFSGPARVSGSAGTGKTIVALHRAVHLARNHPEARVLLTTFSDALASALRTKLIRLIGNTPRLAERIDVYSLDALGIRLHNANCGPVNLAKQADVIEAVRAASQSVAAHKFGMSFLLSEWEHIIDAWQISDWTSYRDVARLGRKTRLPEAQRKMLWSIFQKTSESLHARKLITLSAMYASLTSAIRKSPRRPFDFAIIDEAQDISIAQLRFFAALAGDQPNGLFFAGDVGQRIFQQQFSWKALGVDVRGRSRSLRVNYRTSHQIRRQADRLLASEVADIDGNVESRDDTISVFNGPPPQIQSFDSEDGEIDAVANWLNERLGGGIPPHEIGMFVRSSAQLHRARSAAERAKLPFKVLDEHVETAAGHVSISTMHLAKGLEFRAVAVLGCDDEIVPLQERIELVGDTADLREIYDTERQLLYVACTRARDVLLVTSVFPESEFLDDMRDGD